MHQMHQTSHTRRQNPAAKAQSKSEGQGTRGGGSSWCQEHLIPSSNIPSHPIPLSNIELVPATPHPFIEQKYYSSIIIQRLKHVMHFLICFVQPQSWSPGTRSPATPTMTARVLYRERCCTECWNEVLTIAMASLTASGWNCGSHQLVVRSCSCRSFLVLRIATCVNSCSPR